MVVLGDPSNMSTMQSYLTSLYISLMHHCYMLSVYWIVRSNSLFIVAT